jgi:hypothetical protein
MLKWLTPRMGSQVSSLGTLNGAAQRTLNKSPVPLELKVEYLVDFKSLRIVHNRNWLRIVGLFCF